MHIPHDIIIKPIITERSMDEMAEGKYTFQVAKNANKTQIKRAIEEVFGVEVEKVNTMNVSGKIKRQGMTSGKRSDWKKAIVSLKEGSETIEFFDGI